MRRKSAAGPAPSAPDAAPSVLVREAAAERFRRGRGPTGTIRDNPGVAGPQSPSRLAGAAGASALHPIAGEGEKRREEARPPFAGVPDPIPGFRAVPPKRLCRAGAWPISSRRLPRFPAGNWWPPSGAGLAFQQAAWPPLKPWTGTNVNLLAGLKAIIPKLKISSCPK